MRKNSIIPSTATGVNSSNLTLINLQLEDMGSYQCVATNNSGSGRSTYVAVTINSKTGLTKLFTSL